MSRIEHPLIAVNGLLEVRREPRERRLVTLDERYCRAVQQAGGVPLAIPAVGGPRDVETLLDRIDGLLLTGGDDFDMERLGSGATHPAATRTLGEKQDFDFLLTRSALERGMPVLGICYGMQVMGLIGGGELLQHLPDDRPGGREHAGGVVHEVAVRPGTKLAGVVDVERLPVVSRHHQALARVPAPWTVSATDEEDLIEAIERPDLPFALGVQWHPELADAGSPHDRLFRGLVGAAALATARSELKRTRA